MKRTVFEQLGREVAVVVVDWHHGSVGIYPRAVAYAQVAGEALGMFLLGLRRKHEIPAERVHLVGHSLGAQLSGFAGKYLRRNGYLVGKITGEFSEVSSESPVCGRCSECWSQAGLPEYNRKGWTRPDRCSRGATAACGSAQVMRSK